MNEETTSRILVIDDDIDLLMLLERRLQKEGYDVETAASLQEALEILPYLQPHLILCDINVNGEDGRKLCFEIKNSREYFSTRIIMMSGFDFSQGRAIIFGADELVPKPLNMEYVLLRIEEMLRSKVSGEW